MNQIIRMAMNMLINKASNAAVNRAASGGKRPEEMTQAEREAAKKNRNTANSARRGLNIMRRFGRF